MFIYFYEIPGYFKVLDRVCKIQGVFKGSSRCRNPVYTDPMKNGWFVLWMLTDWILKLHSLPGGPNLFLGALSPSRTIKYIYDNQYKVQCI